MTDHKTEEPFYVQGRCVYRRPFSQYDENGRLLAITFGYQACTLSAHLDNRAAQVIADALNRHATS